MRGAAHGIAGSISLLAAAGMTDTDMQAGLTDRYERSASRRSSVSMMRPSPPALPPSATAASAELPAAAATTLLPAGAELPSENCRKGRPTAGSTCTSGPQHRSVRCRQQAAVAVAAAAAAAAVAATAARPAAGSSEPERTRGLAAWACTALPPSPGQQLTLAAPAVAATLHCGCQAAGWCPSLLKIRWSANEGRMLRASTGCIVLPGLSTSLPHSSCQRHDGTLAVIPGE